MIIQETSNKIFRRLVSTVTVRNVNTQGRDRQAHLAVIYVNTTHKIKLYFFVSTTKKF